jgi:DNA mismatch repair ATPase MutS
MNYPSAILHGSIDALQMFMEVLRKLRHAADAHAPQFESRGFSALFATLQRELSDAYFVSVRNHLQELRFPGGVLISAELGQGNEGIHHVLRQPLGKGPNWFQRLIRKGPPTFTVQIADRDDAGAKALGELRDQGINLAANAVAQSADHALSFFTMLRMELGFYVGCLNLRDKLAALGAPFVLPSPQVAGTRKHQAKGLYDVCLVLGAERNPVGNALAADGKHLVLITGANQGGKSTFLRAVGLAQLMMQCGLFVAAEAFSAEVCSGLFTHFRREEDAAMKSGKFDEELGRMSGIVDVIAPDALVLFNESFAATNEREGSEIARQIVSALVERRIKVFFVTHLYPFARGFFEENAEVHLFLRAERQADSTRTFKLIEGEPLETSFGEDLYRQTFEG